MKRCIRCHEEKPLDQFTNNAGRKDGKCPYCRECLHVVNGASLARNREKHRERNRQWAREHAEYLGQKSKEWVAAHPEQHAEAQRKWTKEHRSEITDYHRQYMQDHPGLNAVLQANKRARQKGVPGELTLEDWRAVLDRYGHKCLCCGQSELEVELSIDHVMPLSRGGPNTRENIQPLCRSCNSRKRNHGTDYRLQQPQLLDGTYFV